MSRGRPRNRDAKIGDRFARSRVRVLSSDSSSGLFFTYSCTYYHLAAVRSYDRTSAAAPASRYNNETVAILDVPTPADCTTRDGRRRDVYVGRVRSHVRHIPNGLHSEYDATARLSYFSIVVVIKHLHVSAGDRASSAEKYCTAVVEGRPSGRVARKLRRFIMLFFF